MTVNPLFRSVRPWVAAVLLAAVAAFAAVQSVRFVLERDFRASLEIEARRRALEVTTQTLNGNVMGSVVTLGLVHQPIKQVALGQLPLQDQGVMDTLETLGEAYGANGIYVVNAAGVVRSCWFTAGVTLTGVDVSFRPYFRIGMRGRENVYAAIGTTTGLRSLYFAAPLYAESSTHAPIIGLTVARLGLERVDSVLQAWPGPALLLAPQDVVFAANREEWIAHLARPGTAEQLEAIRQLKQFGKVFDGGVPQALPFNPAQAVVTLDRRRYAVARAQVQWNDPNGPWNLVLLGDLDALLPARRVAELAAALAALVLAASGLFLSWRGRLRLAQEDRRVAEAELRHYTRRLEAGSALKTWLAEAAADCQRAATAAELARAFLRHAALHVDLALGLFYALDEDGQTLRPVGGYGTEGSGPLAVGQGLVGQCARELAPIELAGPGDLGLRIVWGEGELAPRWVLLMPIAQQGRLLGVVVLGGLQPVAPDQRAFLDALVPAAAMNLEILGRNRLTLIPSQPNHRSRP